MPDARWGEFVLQQFDNTEEKIHLRRDIYDVSSARRLVSKTRKSPNRGQGARPPALLRSFSCFEPLTARTRFA
jgi:hypothetical protein